MKKTIKAGFLEATKDLRWEEKKAEGRDLSEGMEEWKSFDFDELFETIPFAMLVMSIGGEEGEKIREEIRKMRGGCDLNNFDEMIATSRIFEKIGEISPPSITDIDSSNLQDIRRVDEKGRVTIPEKERKFWDMEKGDIVALIRTQDGIKINPLTQSPKHLRVNKPVPKEVDLENLAREGRELSEFFQAYLFHLLDKSPTSLKEVSDYRADFEKTVIAFREIPKQEFKIIYSTFGSNFLLFRWIPHIFLKAFETLEEN